MEDILPHQGVCFLTPQDHPRSRLLEFPPHLSVATLFLTGNKDPDFLRHSMQYCWYSSKKYTKSGLTKKNGKKIKEAQENSKAVVKMPSHFFLCFILNYVLQPRSWVLVPLTVNTWYLDPAKWRQTPNMEQNFFLLYPPFRTLKPDQSSTRKPKKQEGHSSLFSPITMYFINFN